MSYYQPPPSGNTPARLIGGALLLGGLLWGAKSRSEADEDADDLDDVEWVHARTVGQRGAWELDHFIPFSRGGSDQLYNLVPACVDCNMQKSDLMPWEFDPGTFAAGNRDPDHYL